MIERAPEATAPAIQARSSRKAQLLLVLVVAIGISAAAGLLSHAAGNNIPSAILTAGGAFAGAVGVLLAIAHYAGSQ